MKLGKWFSGIAALVLCGVTPAAHAAKVFTVSGTISPDQYGSGYFSFGTTSMANYTTVTSGFRWGLTASFSQPVSGWMAAESECGNCWYILDYKTGAVVDANDGGISLVHDLSNTTFAKATTAAWRNPTSYYGFADGFSGYHRGVTGVSAPGAVISLAVNSLTSPVQYTITGFNSVPEPATWALMILGFGGVGTALRRRSTGALARA